MSNVNNSRIGIENGRAAFAFRVVETAVNDKNVTSSEYRSYVKKLPTLIQVNGLGQALAFCYQKGKTYRVIYDQLHEWLKQSKPQYFKNDGKSFIEVVINLDSQSYREVTVEVMAFLNWMRKFVEGMVKEDDA
ncbi:type III-B CRISPR module-associated protein Cmr5 [Caryophanon latum]|uniref:CRISPR type III-B/RAMP module-associated protein Cmr5 n=1 Tax=Caryophanon latum TaxID=33977 RepID=A0A1C0YV43_9BACL|nr:type III-B CRISPR module-associated protein Cmr5 [Caryophanon latum]OCS91028.1 type III-B CRISPR module-associated protein Cmr5 [Caryophanon latum]